MVNVDFPVPGCSCLPYDLTRTQFRRQANAADNKAATVAVDSLLNYEAVKVCIFYVDDGSKADSDTMQRISIMSTMRLNSMTRTYAHTKRLQSKLPHHLPFSTLVKMLSFQRHSPGSCSSQRKESLTVSQGCIPAYNASHDPHQER